MPFRSLPGRRPFRSLPFLLPFLLVFRSLESCLIAFATPSESGRSPIAAWAHCDPKVSSMSAISSVNSLRCFVLLVVVFLVVVALLLLLGGCCCCCCLR